jgi:hypothetical protein
VPGLPGGSLEPVPGLDPIFALLEGGERAPQGLGGRQLAPLAGPPEGGEQLAAEERGQDADGNEVALAGADPAAPVRRRAR